MRNRKSRHHLWSILPSKVFISHAYADAVNKSKLLQLLPERVESLEFPRREPDPNEAVSNGIVPKIRSCGGLIYLASDRSAESLWVNFERDYALRSGLKVFAFDGKKGTLSEDQGPSIPLAVRLVVGYDGEHKAQKLLEWMKTERSFHFKEEPTFLRLKEIASFVAEIICERQCVIWFLDEYMGAVAHQALQLDPEDVYYACVDTCKTASELSRGNFDSYARWLQRHSMYVRLQPEWQPTSSEDPDINNFILSEYAIESDFRRGWSVDLVSRENDQNIDWNRADDLIVRTTFMIQKAQPFLIDWEELILEYFAREPRRVHLSELVENAGFLPDWIGPESEDRIRYYIDILCQNEELKHKIGDLYYLTAKGRRRARSLGSHKRSLRKAPSLNRDS